MNDVKEQKNMKNTADRAVQVQPLVIPLKKCEHLIAKFVAKDFDDWFWICLDCGKKIKAV